MKDNLFLILFIAGNLAAIIFVTWLNVSYEQELKDETTTLTSDITQTKESIINQIDSITINLNSIVYLDSIPKESIIILSEKITHLKNSFIELDSIYEVKLINSFKTGILTVSKIESSNKR